MDKILRGRTPELLRLLMDEIMEKLDAPKEASAYLAPICADARLITLFVQYGADCAIVEVSQLNQVEVEELVGWLIYGLAKGKMSLRDLYNLLNTENRRHMREKDLKHDVFAFYKLWSI